MRKLLVLVIAALVTSVGVAGAQSNDQGRRLAGPFCIAKTSVSPLKVKNIFGKVVTVPRAGIVRSIGIGMKCNGNENRRFGVPVKGGAGPAGESGPIGPAGPQGACRCCRLEGRHRREGRGRRQRVKPAQRVTPVQRATPGATGRRSGAPGRGRARRREGRHRCSRRPGCYRCDGAAGPKGDTGANGAQGPAGAKGDTGATGAQGATGADGAAGGRATRVPLVLGPCRREGRHGCHWCSGAGAKGDKGGTGATGPAGAQGSAGPQGPAGPAGINAVITVSGGTASGDKQFTVSCPADYFAVSGGFDIQGSVTASFRSNSSGNPTGTTAWTIRQSSGANLSGTVYVYCAPSS